MESEEPFGDELTNFDICGTVFQELFEGIDVLYVNAKTETATSSENNGKVQKISKIKEKEALSS